MPGYPFCGTKGKTRATATGCIKRALDYEAAHGMKPKDMAWSDFVRLPTSVPSV